MVALISLTVLVRWTVNIIHVNVSKVPYWGKEKNWLHCFKNNWISRPESEARRSELIILLYWLTFSNPRCTLPLSMSKTNKKYDRAGHTDHPEHSWSGEFRDPPIRPLFPYRSLWHFSVALSHVLADVICFGWRMKSLFSKSESFCSKSVF